jgi:hypothetical protein
VLAQDVRDTASSVKVDGEVPEWSAGRLDYVTADVALVHTNRGREACAAL